MMFESIGASGLILFSLLGDKVLGQSSSSQADVKPLCFQPTVSGSPTASTLSWFITPSIQAACSFFVNNATASADIDLFNSTGYVFTRLAILDEDEPPPDEAECQRAFSSIVATCVQDGASFGGQWSPRIELSYMISNKVYPLNPLKASDPPSTTTSAGPSETITKATTSITSTTTAPPVPPSHGQTGKEIHEEALLVLLAAVAFLAVSFIPGVGIAAGITAALAIEKGFPVMNNALKTLPPTAKVAKLTGALEAAKFTGVVSRILPNPATAGILVSVATLVLETAAEVAQEAEENENSSSSTTESQASSTTSSESPGPTQHVVAWSSKWPDLLVDAMVQGLPGDGEGHREDFDALGLKVYVTEMTDFLGDAISILPVFKFIVGNSLVESELSRGDRRGVNAEWRGRRRETMADQKLQRRGPDDDVPTFNGEFPFLPFVSLNRKKTPADHLKLLSYKKPDHVDYLHNKRNGEGITIYVVDTGFGDAQTSTFSTEEFNKKVILHYLEAPSGSDLYENDYYSCQVPQDQPPPVLSAFDDFGKGHGTCVATVAASRRFGSARKAQIISWKYSPNTKACTSKTTGLLHIFDEIIKEVVANNGQKKTIVNLSVSFESAPVEPLMVHINDIMISNDIVWVAAAGQRTPDGEHVANSGFPQSLVDLSSDKINTSPAIIVVSGIDSSAPESAGKMPVANWDTLDRPIISVYARYEVVCLTPGFRDVSNAGTSFATPAVAGMIADWLSDPAIVKEIEKAPGASFPHKVRNFLRSASIARNKNRPYINTAYNGYRKWWCKLKFIGSGRSGLQLAAAADDEGRLASNDTLVEARDDAEEDDEPLVVSGTIVMPDYTEKPTCLSSSDLPASQTSSDPVTSSSIIIISSTLSSSTIITSSTAVPDACSDEAGISCDDCNGSFSRGGNVRAVCTTGPATGCACTPTARTCGSGTPAPCDKNGCDGRWDGGGWNATCRVNFPTCPCTPTDATCGPASARSCQEDNCQGSVSNGVATCKNAFKGCACTPSCTIKQPAVPAASSVALNLYNASCCESAPLKTVQVSDLGMCQGVDVDFRAVTQAVGQSLFGRGIKVQLFTDPACVDLAPFVMGLTNTPACASSPGLLLPFRGIILTNGTNPGTGTTPLPPACTTQQPNLVNADTVSVNLYSKSCCDAAPVSTVQLDTLSRCVNTSPFRDFTQTAGQNMFGRKIRILGYTSKGCQGTASATWGLTNTKQCQPATDPNAVYQSIMIFRDGDSTPVNSCGVSPVNPNNNPATVAMTFFSDGRCCDDIANTTVGVAGTCRNLAGGAEWNSVRMAAGTNLDDTGYDIQLFTQPDCADASSSGALVLPVANLATAKSCQGAGKTYKSFRLRAPAAPPTPPAPSCADRPAAVADAAIFQLYKGSQCCTPVQTSTVKVDGCVSVKGGFDHYTETVAQNLFGRGLEVQLFAESGCAGAAWTEYPTNKAVCRDSSSPPGGWLSLRLASPPPVEQCDARPAVASADSISLQVYHDECCYLSQKLTATVNKCVASASTFSGFKEAVGQNLFGRGIKLFVYSDTKCASGEYYEVNLTNNDLCWVVPGRSFILRTPEPTCALPADNDGNSNTAALTLFKSAECCVGAGSGNSNYLKGLTVGVCRTAAQNFRGFDLEVGQNLFGKGYKLVTYTATDCTGTSISWDLSNKYTCFDPGRGLRSVKIVPPATVVNYNEGVVLEGTNTLVQIAWVDGQNPCRLAGEINRWYPADTSTYRSICGTVVCVGPKCFTFEGCSSTSALDLHIQVQGAPGQVYSRCKSATQDVTVCSRSNGDLFDGPVRRYYACR